MDNDETAAARKREEFSASKRELFSEATTDSLITVLLQLGGDPNPAEEIRLVVAWTRTELENRHPEAGRALEEALLAAEVKTEETGEYVDVDYDAILIAAITQPPCSAYVVKGQPS